MGDKISLFDTNFIVCDVETTGGSAFDNRITEIALIKVQGFEITDKLTTLINPRQHIPTGIQYLTGITNEMVMNKPVFSEVSDKLVRFICDSDFPKGRGRTLALPHDTIFVGHNVRFDYNFVRESFLRNPDPLGLNMATLCTAKLARRILKRLKSKSLANVANHLEIPLDNHHRAYDDALATAKILIHFLNKMADDYDFEHTYEVLKFQNTRIYTSQKKSPALRRVKLDLRTLPDNPGVYFMRNRNGDPIYIGKAKSLKDRVSSYFRHNDELSHKIRKMLANVHSVDFQLTDSELSALILESRLIKKEKPIFNSAIKRYRFHPFIKIDVQNHYPRVEKVYEIENDGANYYGPFSSGLTVNKLVKDINAQFKLRKCDEKKFKPSRNHSTCMYYDIGQCHAPCNLTQALSDYRKEVDSVHRYITSAEPESVQRILLKKMDDFAENFEYEQAAFIRDRLKDIEKVLSYQKVITSAINNKKIIIKCDNRKAREVFFIHNGKLVQTYTLRKPQRDSSVDMDQKDLMGEITDTTDYLFFSISKFARHKYTPQELDEIKVISNWLALNRDRNRVLEITERHTKKDIVNFVFG